MASDPVSQSSGVIESGGDCPELKRKSPQKMGQALSNSALASCCHLGMWATEMLVVFCNVEVLNF